MRRSRPSSARAARPSSAVPAPPPAGHPGPPAPRTAPPEPRAPPLLPARAPPLPIPHAPSFASALPPGHFSISSHDRPQLRLFVSPLPSRLAPLLSRKPLWSLLGPSPIPFLRPSSSRSDVPFSIFLSITLILSDSSRRLRTVPFSSSNLAVDSSWHCLSCSPFIHVANVPERLPGSRRCPAPWEYHSESTREASL